MRPRMRKDRKIKKEIEVQRKTERETVKERNAREQLLLSLLLF